MRTSLVPREVPSDGLHESALCSCRTEVSWGQFGDPGVCGHSRPLHICILQTSQHSTLLLLRHIDRGSFSNRLNIIGGAMGHVLIFTPQLCHGDVEQIPKSASTEPLGERERENVAQVGLVLGIIFLPQPPLMLPLQACVNGAQLKLYIFLYQICISPISFLPNSPVWVLLVCLFCPSLSPTACKYEIPLAWKGLTKLNRQQTILSHGHVHCLPCPDIIKESAPTVSSLK